MVKLRVGHTTQKYFIYICYYCGKPVKVPSDQQHPFRCKWCKQLLNPKEEYFDKEYY